MAGVPEELTAGIVLHCGDCLDVLKTLEANSIDAAVTDPPYHLTAGKKGGTGEASLNVNSPAGRSRISTGGGFMGKQWDGGNIAFQVDTWKHVLRVLKPGGFCLAMGGDRTVHRLACAIEDAGFEIRGQCAWIFGSGFPKSLNVGRALSALPWCSCGRCQETLAGTEPPIPSNKHNAALGQHAETIRSLITRGKVLVCAKCGLPRRPDWLIDGLGTALKPAMELIVVARKPLSEPTIAANVLKWGCGALNISGARVHPDTTDKLLSRVRRISLRAASVSGNSTSYTAPLLGAASFRYSLGRLLSAEASSLLAAEHGYESVGSDQLSPNSTDHYPICRHFGDALALLASIDAQPLPLQLVCARIRNRPSMRDGGQADGQLDSHLYECMSLLANKGSALSSGRGTHFHLVALHRAVARYLELCLHCTGTLAPSPSSADRADKAAQWLVLRNEKTVFWGDSLDVDLPPYDLAFNITFGPYLITNTADLLIKTIEGRSRWPANVIHDGSDEVVGAFPDTRASYGSQESANANVGKPYNAVNNIYGEANERTFGQSYSDSGSAARFFYTAKADSDDRLGSKHPTVKPLDLMQYLCRLVGRKGALILDPFAGTGTTGEAALREGMRAVLIERELEYQADIRRRMSLAMSGPDERAREAIKAKTKGKPIDHGPLFGEVQP